MLHVNRRALVFALFVVAVLGLRCIGPIAPMSCKSAAECPADTTCQKGICVYEQGAGLGGSGGGGADAGGAPDGAADADSG